MMYGIGSLADLGDDPQPGLAFQIRSEAAGPGHQVANRMAGIIGREKLNGITRFHVCRGADARAGGRNIDDVRGNPLAFAFVLDFDGDSLFERFS